WATGFEPPPLRRVVTVDSLALSMSPAVVSPSIASDVHPPERPRRAVRVDDSVLPFTSMATTVAMSSWAGDSSAPPRQRPVRDVGADPHPWRALTLANLSWMPGGDPWRARTRVP